MAQSPNPGDERRQDPGPEVDFMEMRRTTTSTPVKYEGQEDWSRTPR